MSFMFGGSKSKSTTTSNSSSSSTTTPLVPEWARSLTESVSGRVGELYKADPYSFVAPAHELQTQAAAGARGLTGMSGLYDEAAGLTRGATGREAFTMAPSLGQAQSYAPTTGAARGYDAAQGVAGGYDALSWGGARVGPAASVLDNLSAYYNPFREQITDPVLADFDVGAGRTRAQQDLDLAGSGAFGGSGAALTRSMTEGELARARSTALSGLLNDMFRTSAGMAEADAGRRQQTSLTQAGFDQETGLANIAALNRSREFGAASNNEMAGLNLGALNRALEFGAAADNEMTGLNLGAINRVGEFTAGAQNAQALANQSAQNEAAQFNATAGEQALQRQMQGARNLASFADTYETGQRANIATQAGIGGTVRDIDQQYRQAPITHGQQIVAMLNGLPISLFTGQTQSGTESSSGTNKTSGTNFSLGASISGPLGSGAWKLGG